jgi:hypothetical protein
VEKEVVLEVDEGPQRLRQLILAQGKKRCHLVKEEVESDFILLQETLKLGRLLV